MIFGFRRLFFFFVWSVFPFPYVEDVLAQEGLWKRLLRRTSCQTCQ